MNAIILGLWFGYISRKLCINTPPKLTRILVTVVFYFVIALVYAALETPSRAVITSIGFYIAFSFEKSTMQKLSDEWAGIWILALFVMVEFLITYWFYPF